MYLKYFPINRLLPLIYISIALFIFSCASQEDEDPSSPIDLVADGAPLAGKVEFFVIKSFEKQGNSCRINESDLTLASEPLLTYSDIVSYNSKTYTFKITPKASIKLKSLQNAPVTGVPFALLVNDVLVYTGYFWPSYSSLACEAITIDPYKAEKENTLTLQLGYPSYSTDGYSSDPRNNASLLGVLRSDKKLIE